MIQGYWGLEVRVFASQRSRSFVDQETKGGRKQPELWIGFPDLENRAFALEQQDTPILEPSYRPEYKTGSRTVPERYSRVSLSSNEIDPSWNCKV